LREKTNDGDSASSVDAQLFVEPCIDLAFQESQINLRWIGFGDPLDQRTLLDAVTTPDTPMNKDLHLPLKTSMSCC
jgi:hypothetical protein